MKAENQLGLIEQWFRRATTLDQNWRESKREEEKLKGKQGKMISKQQEQRQMMPQPLVWQRRQEMLPQQVTTGPTLMEGVERTNVVMAKLWQQGAGFPPRNPYTMDVDKRMNRNCYACGGFGHIAKNCRNQNMGMNRRMETENNNLKEE